MCVFCATNNIYLIANRSKRRLTRLIYIIDYLNYIVKPTDIVGLFTAFTHKWAKCNLQQSLQLNCHLKEILSR